MWGKATLVLMLALVVTGATLGAVALADGANGQSQELEGQTQEPVGEAQEQLVTQDAAIQRAIAFAQWAGMEGEPTQAATLGPWTLAEYYERARPTAGLGPDSAKVGLPHDLPVWAVMVRGKGSLRLPGAYPNESFDWLEVIVNARTGEEMGWTIYYPGKTPPLLTSGQ